MLRESLNPFRYWLKQYFGISDTLAEARNKRSFNRKLDDLVADTQDKRLADELDRTRSFLGALVGLHWSDSLYEQVERAGALREHAHRADHAAPGREPAPAGRFSSWKTPTGWMTTPGPISRACCEPSPLTPCGATPSPSSAPPATKGSACSWRTSPISVSTSHLLTRPYLAALAAELLGGRRLARLARPPGGTSRRESLLRRANPALRPRTRPVDATG